MTRSFDIVDYKVCESEYFLQLLLGGRRESYFSGIQYCTSAFSSACRSITFAMQASLKRNLEFESWYIQQQNILKNDPLSKFFNDFRRVSQHIGESIINSATVTGAGTKYYFEPCHDLPNVPDIEAIEACEIYFKSVLELVYQCYIEFGYLIDGQQYFTSCHFASIGKTIEDAEEELGFARGWTDVGDPSSEPYRWEALRRQAGGCKIQEQFSTWLGKMVPWPEKLPEYDNANQAQ